MNIPAAARSSLSLSLSLSVSVSVALSSILLPFHARGLLLLKLSPVVVVLDPQFF
jgi:hypothetical protein